MNKQIIVVADMFAGQYAGGAELTMDAILKSCPYEVLKINCQQVSYDFIENNKEKFWLLGNMGSLTKDHKVHIATTCNYSIIECDYMYCQYRSSHLHKLQENKNCDCHKTEHGKLAKGLFKRASAVFFMSQGQLDVYKNLFPHMASWGQEKLIIQGSTFSKNTLNHLKKLAEQNPTKNGKWFIQGGANTSWIKDTQGCVDYCKKNNLQYDIVGGLKPKEFLQELAKYKGLIFLPKGFDTNPRITIEAKLLGLELILNDNVQQKNDDWFQLPKQDLFQYLGNLPNKFWSSLNEKI